jgi:hypothetical protein
MKRPDIKELINRLREQHYWGKILVEAADALEHLDNCLFGLDSVAQALSRHLKRQDKMLDEYSARISELLKALEPFAIKDTEVTPERKYYDMLVKHEDRVRARAALKGEK